MLSIIKSLIKMIKIYLSPNYAMKVANDYWQSTDVTHRDMSDEEFDFYYEELKKIINPKKDEVILDYGGEMVKLLFVLKKMVII